MKRVLKVVLGNLTQSDLGRLLLQTTNRSGPCVRVGVRPSHLFVSVGVGLAYLTHLRPTKGPPIDPTTIVFLVSPTSRSLLVSTGDMSH